MLLGLFVTTFLITTYLIGVQKLYRPEIARFLPCMVLFLDNLLRLSIFSNYLREIDHFKLNLNPIQDYGRNPGPNEKK